MKKMKIILINKKKEDNQILDVLREFVSSTDKNWRYVTPEELHKNIDKYYILDIRDKKSYEKGHINKAENIFWQDLLEDKSLKLLPKDKTILLVCYVGHTASQMLVALSLLGYKVKVLKFGMGISPVEGIPVAGWINYGFETEKS